MKNLFAINFLYQHPTLYMRPNALGDMRDTFFDTYNTLLGDNKRVTSCGRCLSSMRLALQEQKKYYDTMQTYNVYRTEKGTLTFVTQTGPVIFIIKSTTESGAKAMLQQLRDWEKREHKNIEDTHGK